MSDEPGMSAAAATTSTYEPEGRWRGYQVAATTPTEEENDDHN